MRRRDREEPSRQGKPEPEPPSGHVTTICRPPGGLAVLAVAAAFGLAACSGGASSPHVADLGASRGNSGGSSATGSGAGNGSAGSTVPAGNPTVLLDEWASCMRSHGDPNQADPTITPDNVIDITWNPAIPGGIYGTNKGGQGDSGPGKYCRAYLAAAQTALRGGQSEEHPDPAQLEKYSECMRANGVPDFPDPSPGGGLSISLNAGGDLNPNSPTFHSASRLCAQKPGVHGFTGAGTPQPGTIELNGALPGGASG